MLLKKTISIVAFIFLFVTVYANKDRIERPINSRFIFQNNDTINVPNSNESLLKSIDDNIINHNKHVLEVLLDFKTGEQVILKYKNDQLISMSINYKKEKLIVPRKSIQKIPTIHFQTFALLWDGNYEKAFESGSLYTRFDIGQKKSFDKYDHLNLYFSDNKFTGGEIWKQIDEKTEQAINL